MKQMNDALLVLLGKEFTKKSLPQQAKIFAAHFLLQRWQQQNLCFPVSGFASDSAFPLSPFTALAAPFKTIPPFTFAT